MSVSVIIPTLNEQDNIANIVNDLKKQTKKVDEIIVVDGSSTDKTIQIVERHKDVVLKKSIKGVGYQRNLGGKSAKGNLLIFLDADNRLEHNFIETATKHFMDHNLDIACPIYYPKSGNLITKLIYIFYNLMFLLFQSIAPSGAGMCILISKIHFQSINGFNDTLVFDDIDLVRRGARFGKFKIIPVILNVSDRRFINDGIIRTFFIYLVLSIFFIFGAFKIASRIKYQFAHYNSNSQK